MRMVLGTGLCILSFMMLCQAVMAYRSKGRLVPRITGRQFSTRWSRSGAYRVMAVNAFWMVVTALAAWQLV